MKVVCELASKCDMEKDCNHAVEHEYDDGMECGGAVCEAVDKFSKCIEVKEKPMEQKLEGIEVKHTILQDQNKKADAGKLRYDLIEYEILERIDFDAYCGIELLDPSAKYKTDTSTNLELWITIAVISLGGWNNFLHELAKVYTFGAKQYGDESWKTVPNAEQRYLGAMQRHIYEFQHGNYLNYQDGMLYHIAQVAWNAISLLWFKQNKGE
jgi:hypothetical protein